MINSWDYSWSQDAVKGHTAGSILWNHKFNHLHCIKLSFDEFLYIEEFDPTTHKVTSNFRLCVLIKIIWEKNLVWNLLVWYPSLPTIGKKMPTIFLLYLFSFFTRVKSNAEAVRTITILDNSCGPGHKRGIYCCHQSCGSGFGRIWVLWSDPILVYSTKPELNRTSLQCNSTKAIKM